MPALGAKPQPIALPKIASQKAQRATPGLPSGPKIHVGITEHQAQPTAKPVNQHQATREAAARRVTAPKAQHAPATGAPATRTAPAKPGAQGLDPMNEYATGKYATGNELSRLAAAQVKTQDAATAAPYRQTAAETGSAEQNALARNQAMGATGQQTLAGLQAGEEASAKTGENNAAQAAIQAANSIRSAGAAGATANGGYGGPQAAAALAEAGQQAGSLGAAASQFQSAMGLSGQTEMAQLRAAAAQRITEGATRLGEGYQVAQQNNTKAEDEAVAKLPTVGAEREALGKSQVADRSALATVGIKEGTLKATEQKNADTVKGNEEKNQTTRQDAAEKNRVTAEGNADKNQTQIAEKHDWTQIAVAEKNNKAKTEAAAIKAGGHSTAEETKLTNQLTAAYETVTQLAPGKWSKPQIQKALLEGKIGKAGIPKVTSPVLVQAAYELYMYHEINNATRSQLRQLGFPEYIKPSQVVGLAP